MLNADAARTATKGKSILKPQRSDAGSAPASQPAPLTPSGVAPSTPPYGTSHDDADADEDLHDDLVQDDFYKVVNEDAEMVENASSLDPMAAVQDNLSPHEPPEDEHDSISLMDTLQCLGVSAVDAANFAASIVRNKPRFRDLSTRLIDAQ